MSLITGVMHRVQQDTQDRIPKEQRYIQTAITKQDIQLVVTIAPGMAKYFHTANYLVVDFTFKRVKGNFDEFNIVTNLGEHSRRKDMFFRFGILLTHAYAVGTILATVYCNRKTERAFQLIFEELDAAIEDLTGKELQWRAIHSEGCRGVQQDLDTACANGFGDYLLKKNLAHGNASPLAHVTDAKKIVEYANRFCITHYGRYVFPTTSSCWGVAY